MIEFNNVSKVYPNGTQALQNITCSIEQGEFVAIIGLSGAGKSTFLRCINQMHHITDGQLSVNQQNVKELKGKSLRLFRRDIGMVFQSFNLVKRISVIKNVLSAKAASQSFLKTLVGYYSKEDQKEALEALDKVGILDKAYHRADELSGGQQQRVALARVLTQNPSIILADEPVASLDPIMASKVMEDFVRINQDLNITVLINIHHVDLALKYADRVIGIRAGEIVYDGPSKNVDEEILENIYGRQLSDEEFMDVQA